MKILLATDGSSWSEAAVHEVARRPWPENSVIKVISIVELPFVPTTENWTLPENYYAEIEKSEQEKAQAALDHALLHLRAGQGASMNITAEMLSGSARDVILDEADHWGASLIVVGSHGGSGLRRFLLGSVSSAVAAHAKCSVEIVRVPEAADQKA
jgi:nucleotide-binding universal stress UspA family protein